jgi:hypothetical protein
VYDFGEWGETMRRILVAVAAAGFVVAGLMFPVAASAGKTPSTAACSLSEDADGNLVASVTGLAPDTGYGFYVYAPLPDGTSPSVANGQFTADATGSLTFPVAQVSYLMSQYPGETSLVFTVYPASKYPQRHGHSDGALTSCTFTP